MGEWLVDVPFLYPAQAVPRGMRKPRRIHFLDMATVALRDVDPANFPAALTFTPGRDDMAWPACIRWDGSGFRYPAWRTDETGEAGIQEILSAFGPSPFLDAQLHGTDPARVTDARRADSFDGTVTGDGREASVALLSGIAASLVLSGGMLWETCLEPAWRADPSSRPPAVVAAWPDAPGEYPDSSWHRADRYGEALDAACEGMPGRFPVTFGTLEVMLPGCLRFSAPDADRLLRAAAYAVRSNRDTVLDRPSRLLAAWAGLRDTLASARSGDVTPRIARGVADFLASWPGRVDPRGITAPDVARKELATAYTRWEARRNPEVCHPAAGMRP